MIINYTDLEWDEGSQSYVPVPKTMEVPDPVPPQANQPIEKTDLERVKEQPRDYKTPAPVADEVAQRLAENPPTETRSIWNSQDADALKNINRRIAAGETLSEAEQKAAKVWYPGSSDFYDRIHEQGQYAKAKEEKSQNETETRYFKTKEDWEAAGRPGGTKNVKVIIGEKPKDKEYEKPDKSILWIGMETKNPKAIERSPELEALAKENPRLYKVLVNEGYENYQKAVNAENFVAGQENKRFERLNTQLPDNQWMSNTELEQIKRDEPELYQLLITKGVESANLAIKENNRRAAMEADVASRKVTLPTIEELIKQNRPSERPQLIKALYQGLTPWNEEAGQTVVDYMKGYPTRVKVAFIENMRRIVPPQSVLKQQYEQQESNKKTWGDAPLWAKLLFPVNEDVRYDQKTGTYYKLAIAEAPDVGKSTINKLAKVAVKERVDWSKITDALKRGEAKTAQEAAEWAKVNNAFKQAEEVAQGRPQQPPRLTERERWLARQAKLEADRSIQRVSQSPSNQPSGLPLKNSQEYQNWLKWKAQYETQKVTGFTKVLQPVTVRIQPGKGGQAPKNERVWTQKQAEEIARASEIKPLEDVRSIPIERVISRTSQDIEAQPEWQTISQQLAQNKNFESASTQEWQQAKEAVNTGIQAKQNAIVQGATQAEIKAAVNEAVKNQVKQQTQTKTETTTQTLTKTQVKQLAKTIIDTPVKPPVKPAPPEKPNIAIKLPTLKAVDKDKRKAILKASGAVGWRQGELNGVDRWDVIVSPYTSREDYVIVFGDKPKGAYIVKGPGSARRTAQILYGQRLRKPVNFDTPGAFNVHLTPSGERNVKLEFNRDADITQRNPQVTAGKVFPLRQGR